MNTRNRRASLWANLMMLTLLSLPCTGMTASTTITFNLDGFTAISVFAPYKVIATQGEDFLVEVIVDAEDADAIDVSKAGSTLILDLQPGSYQFDTLEARVTMPRLNTFEIIGASNSTLSGFDENELDVEIIGTAHVLGQSMQINDLSVRFVGTGDVNFGNIDPLQTAHVDLDGVIQTTLNMDVESTITGRMIGLAMLRYWGTNVDLQVTTIGLAEIERLGDTKPGRPPDVFRINSGLNDAWYNPNTSGQGFFIVVWEDIETIFLSWFTFDTERPPEGVEAILGEPGHRWLTAQGPYEGDTATLEVFVSSGGVFDSAVPAVNPAETEGTITIVWTGCNEGLVVYNMPSLGLMGEIPIERIMLDNVPWCEVSQ